jgi:putative hydrolase
MRASLPPGRPGPTPLRLTPWAELDRACAVDYHMHTSYTDGEASVRQMAETAAAKGLAQVLVGEHIRHSSTYFSALVEDVGALQLPGLQAFAGVETKVLDLDGRLDCPPDAAAQCAAIIGSVHSLPPGQDGQPRSWSNLDPELALEMELQFALAIVARSQAHILGHPLGMVVTRFGLSPLDELYELACACCDHGKAFELNARYCLDPMAWIDVVQRAQCRVSLGSDAHTPRDVGNSWRLFVEGRVSSWSRVSS